MVQEGSVYKIDRHWVPAGIITGHGRPTWKQAHKLGNLESKHWHAKNTDWKSTTWGGRSHSEVNPCTIRKNYINKGGIIVTNVSIRCRKWHPTSWNDYRETHPLPYNNRRIPSTNIIWGSTPHLLWLRCNWTHVPGMSEEAWERSGVDHEKYNNLCPHRSAWHTAAAGRHREQDWGNGTHQTGESVGRPNGRDKRADTDRTPAPEWMHNWLANRTESSNDHLVDCNDEATNQQRAGGQEAGDAMEIREAIPEYTPVPKQAIPQGKKTTGWRNKHEEQCMVAA